MTTGPKTRVRLLRAAEPLFGARGFKKVTVREICHAARANVAAVNYHFDGKLGLYREVLQSAIDAIRATSEAARASGEGQRPEVRLRRYVEVFLARALRPGNEAVHRLVTREMSDPTPALDALVEQGVRPRIEYLAGLVSEIIRCDPKDPQVLRCVFSIQSQAVAYMPNPIATRLGLPVRPTPAQIEQAADHIATFSLAGIRAIGRTRQRSGGGMVREAARQNGSTLPAKA